MGQGLSLFFRVFVPDAPTTFQGPGTRHRRWGLTPNRGVCRGFLCPSLKARVRCAMALCRVKAK